MHFVIKKGTENAPRPLADILYCDSHPESADYNKFTLGGLIKSSEDCKSITWGLSEDKLEKHNNLMNKERQRIKVGKVEYLKLGKARTAGLLGGSL